MIDDVNNFINENIVINNITGNNVLIIRNFLSRYHQDEKVQSYVI